MTAEDLSTRIVLLKGDLTKIQATAIVNAANTELWLGAGVAGAIARAAGPAVETEAMAQGPIPLGTAVVTRAGNLQAHGILYVIHAATMEPGGPATAANIARATFSALEIATDRRMPAIAFPALGSGVGGVSLAECAAIMLGTMAEYLPHNPLPRQVYVACYSDEALQVFRALLAGIAAGPLRGSAPS